VNFRLAPAEVAYIVQDSQTRVLVVGQELAPVVAAVAGELAGVKVLIIGGDGDQSYETWRDAHPAEDPNAESSSADVAFQLYSSGTTGRPKGVELINQNFVVGTTQFEELMELGKDAISRVAMPQFHIGGGGWALAGLTVGATNVLVRDIVPAQLVEQLERDKISHAFLVPAVLQFMLAVPGIGDRDFSALRYFLYGASPISEKVLAESIRTFGCKFLQAYGLTETTGMVVLLPAEDHDPDGPNRHRLRAVGTPVPGTEVRIVAPGGEEDVEPGAVGEIWIRSPQVMKGYWNMPEATEEAIVGDGWFRSGDAGYMDPDGYIYIHDRVKDMIVSGGENIYPAEVENVLMAHPAVADVAVIGVPSEKWGETPKAMVVLAPGASVTEADLIQFCRRQLATFKCPTSVDWVTELPRNPSGKVLKKDLRAPFWAGRDRMVG
jgi:long-chain acyl-CoA synthetase